MEKEYYIDHFRNGAQESLAGILSSFTDCRKRSNAVNKVLKELYSSKTELIRSTALIENWDDAALLQELLLATYSYYVVMLEYRNKVWPYDYMAFSRRIGELWEPFCKLPFEHPVNPLNLIDPPSFQDVQASIQENAVSFIDSLSIDAESKQHLRSLYDVPWSMVDSGGINLKLDLHFSQNGVNYNCDLKSGFSSNEKGNTNRLLLVGSIYRSLGKSEKTILFVRQSEDENNHYLITLKESPYWQVYCGDECYRAMARYTGFDLRAWLGEHAKWETDISEDLRQHLAENDLLKYLTW